MPLKVRILVFPILLFLHSCNIKNQDVKGTYLDSARRLAFNGQYEEALTRYIWYDRNTVETDTNINGVKRSFALSYWLELAKSYPPARDSFLRIRDEKMSLILNEGDSAALLADLFAMNRYLKEDDLNIALYDSISTKFPDLAKKTWWYCLDQLLEAKRYDLLKKNTPGPIEIYNRVETHYKKYYDELLNDDEMRHDFPELITMTKKKFQDKCNKLEEYCYAIDDKKSAAEIMEKARIVSNEK